MERRKYRAECDHCEYCDERVGLAHPRARPCEGCGERLVYHRVDEDGKPYGYGPHRRREG